MTVVIETSETPDGRFSAESETAPGVICYGNTRQDALRVAMVAALRDIALRLEAGHLKEVYEANFACFH